MIHKIAMILVLIGALNWGLVGVTELFMGEPFDLVAYLTVDLIGLSILGTIIYIIVGLSAVILAVSKGGCGDGMMKKGGMMKDGMSKQGSGGDQMMGQ